MTLGTLAFAKKKWEIRCEPHIRNKIKRVFPEVSQRASDVIFLSNNEENCRDLLWFLDRHPLSISEKDRLILSTQAELHVEKEVKIAALLDFSVPPGDFDLHIPAREYQKIAAALVTIKGGVLVADDVGLGKTVTSICLMTKTESLPALVVTMPHLLTQWEHEINTFAPQLKTHIIRSGPLYDLSTCFSKTDKRLPDVIICNYHKINKWADTLTGIIRYVVFDEVQELRRTGTDKYSAAKMITGKAKFKMGLSATPIYNYGVEFFNVIDMLNPGALGLMDEFAREWCSTEKNIKDPQAFGEYLRREGLMIRRTRKEVGRELPPVIKLHHFVDCDKRYLDRIKGSAIELAKIILSNQQLYSQERFGATQEFNTLMRQATGIAKAPYVAEFVKMLLESGEKVILFGWHREVYSIWMDALKDYKPRLYTGTESAKQKDAAKEAFISGDCQVLIISLRSGAGLDGLQSVCSTVVKGELDYCPGVHDQCIGRPHRDGQDKTVVVHYLISEEGSDPIIADILGIKRGQIENIINPDTNTDGDFIERIEVDPGYIKRLAADFLEKMGVTIETDAQVMDVD